jgi:hypothetical protein
MMDLEELAATILAETLATKDIEVNDLQGVQLCSDASKMAGEAVKQSLRIADQNIKNRRLPAF